MNTRHLVGAFLGVLAAVACSVCQADIVRHFQLDTITSGTTPDATGNPDGMLSTSPAPTVNSAGVIGSSFEFTDSDSEYVAFSDPFFGDDTVTLSFWVKRDTEDNEDGPASNWIPGYQTILSRIVGSQLQTYARVGGSQSGGNTGLTISDTERFHHVVVTYDGSYVRTYLDGQAGTAHARTGLLGGGSSAGTFGIGGRGGSEKAMDGLVDDVALFDNVLSVPEIQAIGHVASEAALNYDAGQAQSLFDVFDGTQGSATIGSHTWVEAPDGWLKGNAGDMVYFGGNHFGLVLNDAGGGVATSLNPPPAYVYRIDIDSTDIAGGGSSPPIETQPGWNSLDATGVANNGSVSIDGIVFTPGSSDGSRLRRSGSATDPNDLLADFIYDDGSGQAVVLSFGEDGDLPAGDYEVKVWIWDANRPDLGDMIVAWRRNTAEHIMATDVRPNPNGPAYTFRFTSDGQAAYDIFVRENNDQNFSLLNAVVLTRLPEPSTLALAALGLLSLAVFGGRRKRRY